MVEGAKERDFNNTTLGVSQVRDASVEFSLPCNKDHIVTNIAINCPENWTKSVISGAEMHAFLATIEALYAYINLTGIVYRMMLLYCCTIVLTGF